MDNENSYTPPSPTPAGSNLMMWTLAIIVLLVLGVGGYFLYQNTQNNPSTEEDIDTTINQTETLDTQTNQSTNEAFQQAGVKEFTVTGSSFKFDQPELRVNVGDTVKITYKSSGGIHDFVIDGLDVKTKQLPSGQSETVQFVTSKAGSFEYYCSVGNHRQQGMKGMLIVE